MLDALLDLQCEERPAVPVEEISRLSGRDVVTCVACLHELQEAEVVGVASFRRSSGERQVSGWHADRPRAEALLRERRLALYAPAARLTALAQA